MRESEAWALLRRLVEVVKTPTDTKLDLAVMVGAVFVVASEASALLAEPEDGRQRLKAEFTPDRADAARSLSSTPPAARVEQPTVDEIAEGTRIILDTPVVDKVCKWMMAMARADERSRTPPAASVEALDDLIALNKLTAEELEQKVAAYRPLPRAEAEAMVDRYVAACTRHGCEYTEATLKERDEAFAALLAALTGGEG